MNGARLRREDADGTTADVTVRCNAETYVLLVYGRLDLTATVACSAGGMVV